MTFVRHVSRLRILQGLQRHCPMLYVSHALRGTQDAWHDTHGPNLTKHSHTPYSFLFGSGHGQKRGALPATPTALEKLLRRTMGGHTMCYACCVKVGYV